VGEPTDAAADGEYREGGIVRQLAMRDVLAPGQGQPAVKRHVRLLHRAEGGGQISDQGGGFAAQNLYRIEID
jgi:hypothetical protein